MVSEALQTISECRADHAYATLEIAHQVARHSAERQSSMKVFFVMAYVLEALGVVKDLPGRPLKSSQLP
jgi:hypothetical protein